MMMRRHAALGVVAGILAAMLVGVFAMERPGAKPVTPTERPAPPAGAPGAVAVSTAQREIAGVRVETVTRAARERVVRAPGRVAPDERRLYVVNATVDGWITQDSAVTTGSAVTKDQTLATFYSPEFLSAIQALLFALDSQDRVERSTTPARAEQLAQFSVNLRQFKDSLRNLGMGGPQIDELIRTRRFAEGVNITAPADGVVLVRNVAAGLRFDKGKELYRIADLSRVWVVADVFENDAAEIAPGMVARVEYPQLERAFEARVARVLPRFDGVTRTLKLRLEVDNPGLVLQPDMLVDVALRVPVAPAIAIPADAVLDTGASKSVFVEVTPGSFERRRVETGWRLDGRVEIRHGLTAGERIVTAGNFLIDSESRMGRAAVPAVLEPPPAHEHRH